MVGAAQVVEAAVPGAADQVAGTVHPLPRRERVGHEALGGQRGPAQVAAGQAVPGQVQLAGHAGGDGVQVLVQDVGAGAEDGVPHGGTLRVGVRLEQGVDGAFGGPVEVVAGGVRGLAQTGPQRLADRFAAEQHHARRGCVQQALGDELFGVRGGELDGVDARRADVPDQGGGVAAQFLADQVQLVARDHPQQAVPGGVEAERGGQRGAQPAVRPLGLAEGLLPVGGQQARDRTVAHHHALGAAGGAGGVDHVGGVGPGDADGRRLGGPVGPVLFAGVQDGGTGEAVQRLGQRPSGVGEDGRGAGVGQHVGGALPRVPGVQREERRPGLEYGELGDHRLRRAGQGERDHVLGSDAGGDQAVGEAVRAGVQFGVGQPGLPEDQGREVRRGRHPVGEGGQHEGQFGGCLLYPRSPARSSSASRSARPIRRPGRAVISVSSRPKRAAIDSTVSRSNRSVAKSIAQSSPAGSPSGPENSSSVTLRSNLATPVSAGSASARRPAGSSSAPPLDWRTIATWNSGWRARERAGLSSSTSRSNGTSWCA